MLEFIVLGQVPGTHFIITFSWVIAVSTIIVGTSLLRRIRKQRAITQQTLVLENSI